jgi:hypothetical protein
MCLWTRITTSDYEQVDAMVVGACVGANTGGDEREGSSFLTAMTGFFPSYWVFSLGRS